MRRRRTLRTIKRLTTWLLASVVIAVLTAVAGLFLYVSSFPWEWARSVLAAVFVLLVAGLFVFIKPRWKAGLLFVGLFALVYLWYALIPASNDRDWLPDVARVASVGFDGDRVTIDNVRNFRYRSEDDFDEVWETRVYDLSKLRSVDLYFSYWGPRDIAHTMLSFGFENGDYIAVSVETRKEVGETYDPLRSFFKQFELIYILGDERDLIALRTNTRLEDTYLFPMSMPPENRRAFLVDILNRADELGREPAYYATIKANCTTALLGHLNKVAERPVRFSFKLLLNGYIPELAYERGNLPNDAPFEEVMQRYAISAKAREGGVGPGYSEMIREGIEPFPRSPAGL
ncbi:MAG: DUF4105 domain-containing protein [Phycisphaerales bacterium]